MGLYDRITPSERAIDLSLVVKRIRRHTGLDVVPMLVVEGPADESLLGKLCVYGERQVFAAGTRGLVEQMLVYLRGNPIEGCECVYITDCDGRGKAVPLKSDAALVVTDCCDIEADLVELGVAQRVIAPALASADEAEEVIDAAKAIAVSVSAVRRAADRAGVSMKRGRQRLRLLDLPWTQIEAWRDVVPDHTDAVAVIERELDWTSHERNQVEAAMPDVARDYRQMCSGKDVVDATFRLLEERGSHRFESVDSLQRAVDRDLDRSDLAQWKVGQRVRAWESSTGCTVLMQD